MRPSGIIAAGGVALVGGAVAFLAVFAYLAARFNYPAVLDGCRRNGSSGAARHRSRRSHRLRTGSMFPQWIGYVGVVTAFAGMIGMFRNVTHAVAHIADINNYLLPLWMIVFGVSLIRHHRGSKSLSQPR
jgi:hypothetical protein